MALRLLLPVLNRVLGDLPKPALVLITGAAIVFVMLQVDAWRVKVNQHVKDSAAGDLRLSVAEQKLGAVERQIETLQAEFREQRVDSLNHYRWMAEQAGDRGRVRMLDRKIRRLRATIKDDEQ